MFSLRRQLSLCRRSFLNENIIIRRDQWLKFIRRKRHNLVLESVKPVRLSFSCYEFAPRIIEDNVPVIIMHGLFGNKNNWAGIAKALHNDTGKRVFSLDARNHGDSPHSDEHTYIHLAKDVASFMDDHSMDSGAFVGHSMGGRALMAFALLYTEDANLRKNDITIISKPHRVESLAIVDISPVGTPEGILQIREVFGAMQAIELNAPGYGLYDYRKVVEAQLGDALQDKKIGQFLSMNLVEIDSGKFGWKINLDSLLNNYDPHIMKFPVEDTPGTFAGPTAFICGGNSTFFDFSKVDEIKKLFPESFFMTVEDAGHWVHVDQPHKFLQILCVFIKRFRMK